jgi:ankyrin repeat protein
MSLFKVLWPYRHPDPRVQEEIFRLLKETDENFNEHRLIGLIESLKKKSQSVDFVDFYGKTALHLAAGRGLTSVVMLLVSAHANIEAQDKLLGRPVICFAIENGHKETVKCLYDLGASIKKKREGRTPLHWAFDYGQRDVADYLLDVTSITAWGDARCREMLLCSHLFLSSSSLKHDVAPVLTSSLAVSLAYKRCA